MTAPTGTPTTAASGSLGVSPWYKRRAWLVSATLVVVVAVTVVTDLPQHASRSGQISDDTSVMTQLNTDVGPCSYALGESFTIYRDLTARTLTPSEDNQVPGLLGDDQSACSFTDDSIYQLSTIDVPGSASGKYMGQLVSTVTLWATSDALTAIEEIQALDTDPSSPGARQRLAQAERLLGHDRAQAEAELHAADTLVGTQLPALHLAQAPTSVPGP
jgi:hypothetical protein